jgi:hypothetical protein
VSQVNFEPNPAWCPLWLAVKLYVRAQLESCERALTLGNFLIGVRGNLDGINETLRAWINEHCNDDLKAGWDYQLECIAYAEEVAAQEEQSFPV